MRIIAGFFKNRPIQSPKGQDIRPTSGRLREALFNICQGECDDGLFLDLFAGSGAMGFEALSRGAKSATFVDSSKDSIRCIHANADLLQVKDQVQVIYGDVFDILAKLAKKGSVFDIIYADPPYEKKAFQEGSPTGSYSGQVLDFIESHPALLASKGSLFLEDDALALPEGKDLLNLTLKSMRKLGRSALQHYVKK